MKIKNSTFLFSIMALILIIILSIIITITIGPVKINPLDVWKIIINNTFNKEIFQIQWAKSIETIVWNLRLPRILMAFITGATLSFVGVLMQALTRNSLANPYILGISSGASAGAVASIILGIFGFLGYLGPSIGAFLGAILSSLIVFKIAHSGSGYSSSKLVLTGVAVSAMFSSLTTFMVYTAKDSSKLRSAMFWMVGSVGGAKWNNILLPFLLLIISTTIMYIFNKELDGILIGEDTSKTLGINTELIRKIIIIISTLLTGFIVSLTGIIGFIGLIIPHISRQAVGSTHKKLIPFSILSGGLFLIWADTFARTAFTPEEIPIGVITSFLGAPFFLYLLRKNSYSFGGKK
ncbi:iron ABC transporter permease [Oceanotoga sp.]|uniref:FecCD family ABC transporter permease n=1 Tax=Oceanotoga sp. TaxID=2108366 RepID=UPI0028064040|nr:iron ABC transporter permease [Oceanotoga sp.]